MSAESNSSDFNSASHPDVARVVVSRNQIARRVEELAGELSICYAGGEITIVMVLTGALVFVADLIRALPLPVRIEPVSVSSYPGQSTTSGACRFRLPPPETLAGRDVLIVDDIYDSGQTMRFLTDAIQNTGPAGIKSCVLLRKARPDLPNRRGEVNFVGFDIPDEFVVGYGLDFGDLYRNLPDICVLAEHAREVRP